MEGLGIADASEPNSSLPTRGLGDEIEHGMVLLDRTLGYEYSRRTKYNDVLREDHSHEFRSSFVLACLWKDWHAIEHQVFRQLEASL